VHWQRRLSQPIPMQLSPSWYWRPHRPGPRSRQPKRRRRLRSSCRKRGWSSVLRQSSAS